MFAANDHIFPTQWQLALSGELQTYLAKADEAVLRAAKAALVTVVTEGKDRLRSMVVKAGLGREGAGSGKGSKRSLASAVRFELYPKTGLARDPAAFLYIQPSAVKIYKSFEEGARITAKGGRFITVPIPNSPASREVFGDKPRGTTVLEKLKARGIEIAYVPGNSRRPAMLVANSVRISSDGRLSKIQRRGGQEGQSALPGRKKSFGYAKGSASVPLFWLVTAVNIPKRLDMGREFERIATRFFTEFTAAFARELARVEADTRSAA